MEMRRTLSKRPLALLLAAVLLLASLTTVAAAPQQQSDEDARGGNAQGFFGEVVRSGGGVLVLRTANGEEVSITISSATEFRAPGVGTAGAAVPRQGDRVGVLAVSRGSGLVAQSVMVVAGRGRPPTSSVSHISGVVSETNYGTIELVTEDGRRVAVAFGLNGHDLRPGAVVTVVGRLDPQSGTIQATSAYRLEQTIERLNGHLVSIEDKVDGRQDQVRSVTRIRRLVDELGTRQMKLVSEVLDRLPDDAKSALERAVQNLEEAKRTVSVALEKAMEIVSKQEYERERLQRTSTQRLPDDLKPQLRDVAGALELTEAQLIERLKSGKDLAQVAQDRGVTLDQVNQKVVERTAAKLRRLAADGDLAPESVDALLGQVREHVADHVQDIFEDDDVRPDLPFSVADMAGALGIAPEELFARLREGASIDEVLRSTGITGGEWTDSLTRLAKTRAEGLVQDGQMRPEDVDRLLGEMREKVEAVLFRQGGRRGPDRGPEEPSDTQGPSIVLPFDQHQLAKALGLSLDELTTLMGQGVTVQQLVERGRLRASNVLDSLLAETSQKLTTMVEAGELDRQRAAYLLEEARKRLAGEFQQSYDEDTAAAGRPLRPEAATSPYPDLPLTLEQVAAALGISVDELHRWLAQPGGIRNFLNERGLDPEQVAGTIVDKVEGQLSVQARAGDISRAEMNRVLAQLKQRLLNDLGGRRTVRPTATDIRPEASTVTYVPFNVEAVAHLLGRSPEELRKLLAEGVTVAVIAERSNVSLEHVINGLMTAVEREANALLREGQVSAELVREKLAAARENTAELLRSFRLASRAEDEFKRLEHEALERREQFLDERARLERELLERRQFLQEEAFRLERFSEEQRTKLEQELSELRRRLEDEAFKLDQLSEEERAKLEEEFLRLQQQLLEKQRLLEESLLDHDAAIIDGSAVIYEPSYDTSLDGWTDTTTGTYETSVAYEDTYIDGSFIEEPSYDTSLDGSTDGTTTTDETSIAHDDTLIDDTATDTHDDTAIDDTATDTHDDTFTDSTTTDTHDDTAIDSTTTANDSTTVTPTAG